MHRTLKNGPVQVPEEVKNGPVEVKNGPVQRNLHNFLLTKAMKVHENLLESLTSLLSNESSGDQFGYCILPLDQTAQKVNSLS